jgi:hypothetical protein
MKCVTHPNKPTCRILASKIPFSTNFGERREESLISLQGLFFQVETSRRIIGLTLSLLLLPQVAVLSSLLSEVKQCVDYAGQRALNHYSKTRASQVEMDSGVQSVCYNSCKINDGKDGHRKETTPRESKFWWIAKIFSLLEQTLLTHSRTVVSAA